jgi:hypothetical protein
MFYTDSMFGTTSSRLDYTLKAGLRDLGKPGTPHIASCYVKREGLEMYNSSVGTKVMISLCAVACFSMTIAGTKSILVLSTNTTGSKGWPYLSDMLSMALSTPGSKATINGTM